MIIKKLILGAIFLGMSCGVSAAAPIKVNVLNCNKFDVYFTMFNQKDTALYVPFDKKKLSANTAATMMCVGPDHCQVGAYGIGKLNTRVYAKDYYGNWPLIKPGQTLIMYPEKYTVGLTWKIIDSIKTGC